MVTINNERIAVNIKVADTFFKRLKGLMLKKNFFDGDGLILYPCKQIHTFGMRINIDVIYIDKDMKVVDIEKSVKKNKFGKRRPKSYYVVELPEGTLVKYEVKIGDTVIIDELNES